MFNSKDSPEKVAEDFVSYMANFKLEEAKKLLAEDVDEYLKNEIDEMIETLKEHPNFTNEQGDHGYKMKDFTVTDVDEGSTYTFVHGTITYVNGETESIVIDLLEENGKWKVEDSY